MFKKILLSLLLLFLVVSSGGTSNARLDSLSIKDKVKSAKTFNYYLSRGSASIGQKMNKLDVIVVEPIEMEQKYIVDAQKHGTLVYGYINAMEADKWNEDFYKQLKEEDFYHDKNGKRKYISKWDAYLVNMASPHYQEVLLKEIKKRVVDRKLDGVFFDTVGDIDDDYPKADQQAQREAMKKVMQKVKSDYKGLSIAQNWGFDTLAQYTAPYVDFVFWEDFNYSEIGHDDWSLEKMELLKKVRSKYGTQVFALAFKDEKKSRELAAKNGFKFLYHPAGSNYNKW